MADIAALLDRAREARLDDRPDDARALIVEAVALARAAGDRSLLGQARARMGQIDRDGGDLESALGHYREAASIARELGDRLAMAHRLRHVADIEQDRGRLDLAEPCYDEALAIYRAQSGPPSLDLANIVRPIAALRERQGRIEEAAGYWAEAGAIYASKGLEAGARECSRRLEALQRS